MYRLFRRRLDILAPFVKQLRTLDCIVQVSLFGSMARGDITEQSDIDIAVFHNCSDEEGLQKTINQWRPEIVQVTYLHVDDFAKQPELIAGLAGDGILLAGRPIEISCEDATLTPYVLFSYSLSHLSSGESAKVNRALHGGTSQSHSSSQVYTSSSVGLIGSPGIRKVNRGVLLVVREQASNVRQVFERFGVRWREISIWML